MANLSMVDRLQGEGSFIYCKCSGKMTKFDVVCTMDEKHVKILSLVCPLCNAEIKSEDGVILKVQ